MQSYYQINGIKNINTKLLNVDLTAPSLPVITNFVIGPLFRIGDLVTVAIRASPKFLVVVTHEEVDANDHT